MSNEVARPGFSLQFHRGARGDLRGCQQRSSSQARYGGWQPCERPKHHAWPHHEHYPQQRAEPRRPQSHLPAENAAIHTTQDAV